MATPCTAAHTNLAIFSTRDAQPGADFTQGQPVDAFSADGGERLIEEPAAQVAVMVGAAQLAGCPRRSRRGIPHLLVVPALVLTFLLGPAGLLLYLATRWFAPGKGAPTLPAAATIVAKEP